ncbi:LANO_0F01838g1_1 [Lachancea nothofagi CBS 11611]|uniref:LANO_0F01838g1_1 n=1 Tax=Lachancea nothofagi CBS 11611 TaxID=1266666 RepID=A0A1G4K6H9_9SACH|nr:LANO_0F01838g1_1 [Lachancea nothofagi CBS 11611]
MLRFVQQSHVLKTRVSNQFVSASARSPFHHSLRLNSSVAMERTPSQEAAAAAAAAAAPPQVAKAVGKVRAMRKNIKIDKPLSATPDSPWFHKVCAFEDCVAQTLYMSQTPRRRNNNHNGGNSKRNQQQSMAVANTNPLFWDSIGRAMGLYRELLGTPELNSDRVSKLVHLLHNGLRANRNQLTRMNKKPDYDSQSFHKEMTNYLCESLREISQDVLSSKVELNEYGAMHLITAFKELLLLEEAVSIWRSAINGANSYTANIFLNPRVVGVVLPILYDNGVTYAEIQELYEKSSAMINYFHPNLSVGMIRASLSAGENEMALTLFQKLCEESSEMKYGYLIETHLSFIGECKDLSISQAFFDKALNNEMPYKIDLQVSYVKSFLRNIWSQTRDFQKVYDIWYKSSVHYGRDVNHGISSSLNDTFFDIFFEHYSQDKITGLQQLQEMISTYNNIKPIDEPFFNIILAKCTVWRDRQIIESIDKAYDLYQTPRTIVAYRILLKSMGSVHVTNEEIFQRWCNLVSKSDEIGQSFIANADWAALRDATVTWTQKYNSQPEELYASDGFNAAMQAANASGAFDDIPQQTPQQQQQQHADRLELYMKIVKRYSPFCRDSRQLSRLTSGTAVKYPVLQQALSKFNDLDVNDVYIPQFHNLRSQH